MLNPSRFYLRCLRCCAVVATEGQPDPATVCVCGGRLKLMGRVGPKRGLVRDEDRCACDGRCTNATGPSCDCSCRGANHGSQRLTPIVVDAGSLPRLAPVDPEECLRRAAEYQAKIAPLRKARNEAREAGHYHRERTLTAAISYIAGLTSHKGRMAKIELFTKEDLS